MAKMEMEFNMRLPGANYVDRIYLDHTDEGLKLTVDDQDEQTSIVLNPDNVRDLRLALQRYERLKPRQVTAQERFRRQMLDGGS